MSKEKFDLETTVKKLYEAMFLVDSAEASSDWDGVNETIRNILKRAGADIVSMRKWDERRMAYTIKGKTRGTYILCYFRANGGSIRGIERDVQLSERIMRVLILCAEHLAQEDVERSAAGASSKENRRKDVREPSAEQDSESDEAEQEGAGDLEKVEEADVVSQMDDDTESGD